MQPQPFSESNKNLTAPIGWKPEDCGDLPVWCDGRQCVSCWRPSWRERLAILIFGRVWLYVVSGLTQPPVALTGAKSVFQVAKAQAPEGVS